MRLIERIVMTAAVLALFAAGPAFAGTVYSWVTEEGTYAFTDDAKRIPQKYRSEAKRRNLGKLSEYQQLTRSDLGADEGYSERLGSRLEGLRQQNQPAPAPVHAAGAQAGRNATYFGVRTGGQTALQVPIRGDYDEKPLVVDRIRSKASGRNTTRTLTVVKQGDRVISVVGPRHNDGPPIQAHDSDFY